MTSSQPRVAAYLATYAALLVGLAATVGLAYLSLGPLTVAAMLLVAFAKATLVVLVFMHVMHAPGLTRIAVVGGLIWLAILIAFAMSDYLSRDWIPMRAPATPAASDGASETPPSEGPAAE